MPRAFVTGASGQDGSYLCELLLAKGYDVFGLLSADTDQLTPGVIPVPGDLADAASLFAAMEETDPDEVYNLAARSFVGGSWDGAISTAEISGIGALRVLEAARIAAPRARFFQASTSEVFGRPADSPQNESTRLEPVTPYGVAKAFAHHATVAARESRGQFAVAGILFNHESPRRPAHFVTRKITRSVARISLGLQDTVTLGSLDARRDWGFAGDYVLAMWLSLQASAPRDYVIATGVTHSIRELLEVAFRCVGISDWESHVLQDEAFIRPVEPGQLVGDATRARTELGWAPVVGFEELIASMVERDLDEAALSPLLQGI